MFLGICNLEVGAGERVYKSSPLVNDSFTLQAKQSVTKLLHVTSRLSAHDEDGGGCGVCVCVCESLKGPRLFFLLLARQSLPTSEAWGEEQGVEAILDCKVRTN